MILRVIRQCQGRLFLAAFMLALVADERWGRKFIGLVKIVYSLHGFNYLILGPINLLQFSPLELDVPLLLLCGPMRLLFFQNNPHLLDEVKVRGEWSFGGANIRL